jgi:hypothetical protein
LSFEFEGGKGNAWKKGAYQIPFLGAEEEITIGVAEGFSVGSHGFIDHVDVESNACQFLNQLLSSQVGGGWLKIRL